MNFETLFRIPMKRAGSFYVDPSVSGSRENWDRLASFNPIHAAVSYDDEAGEQKNSLPQVERLLSECPSGSVILDLGCGYGRIAKYLLPQRNYAGYVGLDNSLEMLNVFERRHAERSEERGTPLALVNGEIDRLPFKDNAFDIVIVSAVWHHNPKSLARRSIAETLRVLKPGGKLLVFASFPQANLSHVQELLYVNLVLPLQGRNEANGPVRIYTQAEVRRILSGFSNVRVFPQGCELIPSHLLFLPRMLNRRTWKRFAIPFNRAVCRAFGSPSTLGMMLDVVAVK